MTDAATIERSGDHYLITSPRLARSLQLEDFDPALLKNATQLQHKGRAAVFKLDVSDSDTGVLRHYFRGGQAARLSKDRFLWTGINRTRAVAEYRLLEWMSQQQLPTPEPLGARVTRRGLFYSCDLITRYIPDAITLADHLQTENPEPEKTDSHLWGKVGAAISQVHRSNVHHSDLNARNILIFNSTRVVLIDFDRCRIMPSEGAQNWKSNNLQRLKRSLNKLTVPVSVPSGATPKVIKKADMEANWKLLLDGYKR